MRRASIALVFTLSLPSITYAQAKDAVIVNLSAQLADMVSTEYAINRGAVEANPLLGQHRGRRIAIKSAGAIASFWLIHRIAKDRPRAARVVSYSVSAIVGAVAIRNVRIGMEAGRE